MRALALALVLVVACHPPPKRGAGAPEPIESETFDLVVHVPQGWQLVGVDRADQRMFVHLEQGDVVLWVGAHMADQAEDALAILQARGNTHSTLQTSWLGLPAAIADADDPFSTEGKRVETRLVATAGKCQYEMTIAGPAERGAAAHEMLLALRNIASGRGILYPKAEACAPPPVSVDAGVAAYNSVRKAVANVVDWIPDGVLVLDRGADAGMAPGNICVMRNQQHQPLPGDCRIKKVSASSAWAETRQSLDRLGGLAEVVVMLD